MLVPPLNPFATALTVIIVATSAGAFLFAWARGRTLVLTLVAANITVAMVLLVASAARPLSYYDWLLGPGLSSAGFAPIWLRHFPGLVYTVVTCQFVHLSLFHLGFNMVMLLLWGPSLESRLGTRRTLVLYLLSGIASAVLFATIYALLPQGLGVPFVIPGVVEVRV